MTLWFMTFMIIVAIIDNSNKDNPETCDIWDTDNNTDNWEPEIMTIFVIWQLIVTLDSIRNSCDVFFHSDTVSCKATLSVAHSEPMLMVSGHKNSQTWTGHASVHAEECFRHPGVLLFGIHPQPLSTNQSWSIPIGHGLVKMCDNNTPLFKYICICRMVMCLCWQVSRFPTAVHWDSMAETCMT